MHKYTLGNPWFGRWWEKSKKCYFGSYRSDIKAELARKVQKVRDILGKSIRINSGIRCIRHNGNIGATETSSHVDGWAADLQTKGSAARYEMLKAVMQVFDRVGIAKNFIHVDVDATKTAGVVWTYDKKS